MSTNKIAIAGLMTSITCILGPISIAVPFSPVPISLGLFGILLTTTLLDAGAGVLSCTLYLLLGLVGLPVFSGFTSGVGALLGPTGGYLLGYLAVTACSGLFQHRNTVHSRSEAFTPPVHSSTKKQPVHLLQGAGMVCGLLICYLFGSVWLAHFMDISFSNALLIGVLPYIPADLAKLILALWLGRLLRKRLAKANLV